MAQILHKFNPLLHVAKNSLTSRGAVPGLYRQFTTFNHGLPRQQRSKFLQGSSGLRLSNMSRFNFSTQVAAAERAAGEAEGIQNIIND